jgi:hypothetical protein
MSKKKWYSGLPPVLKVGPYHIKLEVIDAVAVDGKHTKDFGVYDYNTQCIQVRREQPSDAFAVDTVVHEVLHAIYSFMGLSRGNGEERIVGSFSTGLIGVLRDNPEFTKWLARKCA